jgi:formylglycine-generating enzyme required for sulfatase activity
LDIEQVQLLQTALSFADLPAAHRRLADIYHDRHRQAEVVGDRHAADRFAYLLEAHSRGRYDDYLRGVGWLTLETSRPVTVRLSRYVPRHRRLWPEPVGVWPAPLASVELPIGSYLAELVTEEGACYRLPLEIRRSEGTTGALAPGGPPVAVWIPQPGAVPEGTVYVPAGPLWSGGGEGVFGASLPLRRVWVEGFFIDRFPVTNARYLDFLNTLVAEGRAAAAAAHCPRERAAGGGEGRAVYGLDGQGRYVLVSDGDGDVWDPQWPVVSLTIASARAFAAWRTAVTGRVHRLPFELEWEKAARGADRRSRVWGTDAIDPTWCRIGMSAGAGRSQPVPVGDCPADESPYGVRGLAGNVSDICGDHYTREGSPVVDGRWQVQPTPTGLHPLRGAAWNAHPSRTHIGVRGGISANGRSSLCGFRLVVPLDGPAR